MQVLKIYSTPHKILPYFFFMVGSKIGKINSLRPIPLSARVFWRRTDAELSGGSDLSRAASGPTWPWGPTPETWLKQDGGWPCDHL